MKKGLLAIAAAWLLSVGNAAAQDDKHIFNHVGVGVGVGTTGIDFQVAAPITKHFAVRAGYSFLPKISPEFDVDFDSDEAWMATDPATGEKIESAKVKGELNIGDFKFLADYYPFSKASFHVTAGFYIGKSKLASAYNTTPLVSDAKNSNGDYMYWGTSGPELGSPSNGGTYTVVSDDKGNIKADVKVNSFKPYVGIGFGRAVPTNRLNVSFDLGVQFWGKPALWTNISDDYETKFQKVDRNRITNPDEDYCDDIKDALKIAEKVIVYPVLTLRLNGRIF